MDKRVNNYLILILISTLVSCAPTAYLSSKVDPHFTFRRSQPIYVDLKSAATVEDKQFHNFVVTEMKRAGFTVVDEPTRDSLVLFFGLGEDTTFIDSPLVLPNTTTTTGAIGGESFTATTRGAQVVPYQFPYTAQRIILLLYRTTPEGKLDRVWEGYIGTEQKNFHASPTVVVGKLVNVIGKNFEGDVALNSRSLPAQNDRSEQGELTKQLKSHQDQSARLKAVREGVGDPSILQKACDKGEGIACHLLSFEYFNGRKVPKDHKRGMALLEQGCDSGEPVACSEAATQYKRGLLIQKNTNKARSLQKRAFPLYQKACEGGRAAACGVLGAYYERGEIVAQDTAQALLYYERACEAGSLSGCVLLGDLYVEGNGVPKEPERAAQIYSGACEVKELAYWERKDYWKTRCYRKFATLLETGQGGPKDQARAAVLFRKACDEGDDGSCVSLGQQLIAEPSTAANKNDALPLLRKGCQSSGGASCQQLGAALTDLCEGGQTDACIELSDMNYKGLVTSKDFPLVESVDQSLCDKGNLGSCYRFADKKMGEALSQFYDLVEQAESRFGFVQKVVETGRMKHYQWSMDEIFSHFSRQDNPEATDHLGDLVGASLSLMETENWFHKYCQAGHLKSCEKLNQLALYYSEGIARPVNPVRGETLARWACEEGLADACTRLGRFYEEGVGTSQDSSRAAEVYLKACNKEDANACLELAHMYKKGRGVQQDISYAETLYQKSIAIRRIGCERTDNVKDSKMTYLEKLSQEESYLADCFMIALHYEAGWGVPKNYKVAGSLYMKACSGGRGPKEACEKGVPLYNQDCEKGNAVACTILGNMYGNGIIVPRDMEQAAQLYERACAGKDGEACYRLGQQYKYGRGGIKEPGEAQALFEKACSYGYSPGCSKEFQN